MLISVLGLSGCSQSGVPQEKYDQVVSERDDYKEKYEKLLNDTAEKNVDKMLNDMTESEETELETSGLKGTDVINNDADTDKNEDGIVLKTGKYIVGEDVEAGKYDVFRHKESGVFDVKDNKESTYSGICHEYVEKDTDAVYINLILENGNVISVIDGLEVTLIKR